MTSVVVKDIKIEGGKVKPIKKRRIGRIRFGEDFKAAESFIAVSGAKIISVMPSTPYGVVILEHPDFDEVAYDGEAASVPFYHVIFRMENGVMVERKFIREKGEH